MSEKAVPAVLGERKSADSTLRTGFEATGADVAKGSRSATGAKSEDVKLQIQEIPSRERRRSLGRLLREARN
jgi:hypothetical protein